VSEINFLAINSYIALVAAVVNFTLALLVMLRTSRETVYTTFALTCLGVAWWNFWDFMVYASGNPLWLPMGLMVDTPWKNIVSIGSTLAAAAMFHFTLALVGRLRGNRAWIILAYALAVSLAAIPIVALYNEPVNRFWTGPGWNLSFFILLFPFILASIILIAMAFWDARGKEEGQWLKFILAAVILQVSTGMTDLFHKIFLSLPPLGHLGSVIGPVILATGVLRHRRAFDILAQAQSKLELISRMAAEVAHEVKSPLTAIKGIARLQADIDDTHDWGRIQQYQDIMTEEIERIEGILNNLQDLTKPLKIVKEKVDIDDLIKKVLQLTSLDELGLSISFEDGEKISQAEADPSLLRQVILNIVRNASEACEQDGNLDIRTSMGHDSIRIEFTDDGPGVSEEDRLRIFEPFFTTKSSGLGLGLVVTSRIVEAHGGRIFMDNVKPKGAKMTISIPR
jgi:signal transduction histidine kinase